MLLNIYAVCLGDKLWWADQGTDQIGTCDKSDGGNWKVLRNNTSPMMHMRIYNESLQTGTGRTSHCRHAYDVPLSDLPGRNSDELTNDKQDGVFLSEFSLLFGFIFFLCCLRHQPVQ